MKFPLVYAKLPFYSFCRVMFDPILQSHKFMLSRNQGYIAGADGY